MGHKKIETLWAAEKRTNIALKSFTIFLTIRYENRSVIARILLDCLHVIFHWFHFSSGFTNRNIFSAYSYN